MTHPFRTSRVITIRCTRSRGPRGFFCLQDVRRGPVNVAVIALSSRRGPWVHKFFNNLPESSQDFACVTDLRGVVDFISLKGTTNGHDNASPKWE